MVISVVVLVGKLVVAVWKYVVRKVKGIVEYMLPVVVGLLVVVRSFNVVVYSVVGIFCCEATVTAEVRTVEGWVSSHIGMVVLYVDADSALSFSSAICKSGLVCMFGL